MKTRIAIAVAKGIALGAAAIAAAALSGCSLTVSPDGSRVYTPDKTMFFRAIEILTEK